MIEVLLFVAALFAIRAAAAAVHARRRDWPVLERVRAAIAYE